MAVGHISLTAGGVAAMRQVDQKLIFIPVVFFLLRIWGTIQFIISSTISPQHCISYDAYIILYILAYLQVRPAVLLHQLLLFSCRLLVMVGKDGATLFSMCSLPNSWGIKCFIAVQPEILPVVQTVYKHLVTIVFILILMTPSEETNFNF